MNLASTPSRQPGRLLELDGLRAFAILPVLMHHFAPTVGPLRALGPFFEGGWMGVDLFFVMSGYLISGILLDSVGRTRYYANFILRRALRILPLYYVCIAVATAAVYFYPDKSKWADFAHWGGPLWFVFYLGNFQIAHRQTYPPVVVFGPMWSLQVEEQFYLLYPMLIAAVSRLTMRRILLCVIVAAPLLRCIAPAFVPESDTLAYYVLTPFRMDSLAMGGLIALMVREGGVPFSPRQLLCAVLASFAITTVILEVYGADSGTPIMRTLGYSVIDLGCAALLAQVVTNPRSRVVGELRRFPLVFTGQIAYGLYLLHVPVSSAARAIVSRVILVEPHSAMNMVVSLVASYAIATASWFFFESPFLALKDKFSKPSKVRA